MESFLPSEIARLVLGYLEEQKCEETYNTFLKTSSHLEECLKMKEDGRKFRTHVLGLSLLDILYEYSAIYSLVQERLKKVDPEAVERLRHSGTLLDKITFLLNSTSSGQTMLFSISLPPGNSPQTSAVAHAHVRKRLRTNSANDKRKDTLKKNCRIPHDSEYVNNDHSIIEAGSSNPNLETTNLSSLPGNLNKNIPSSIGQQNEIVRTPKRKIQANNKRQSRPSSVVPEQLEENFDITALTQALLDNHELHEKIAENINKVICTPENNSNVSLGQDTCSALNPTPSETNTTLPNNNNFTMELDNVIKKIVHDTESDPIFENFLHEVVGPPTQEETSDDYDDKGISNTSTPCKSILETVKKPNLKNKNRNIKLKQVPSLENNVIDVVNTVNTIDDQNAVAVEGIISINAPEGEEIISNPTTTEIVTSNIVSTVATVNTAVIASESISLNTVLPISAPNQNLTVDTTTSVSKIEQNILVNNQNNKKMLMFEQQPIQQPPTYLIADSFPSLYQQPAIMPDNRIIFLSNKTSTIGSQYLTMQPTFQISQPTTVITDNDIMTMPTVFISDDPKTSSGYIISQPAYPAQPKSTRKVANKKKIRTTPRKILLKNDASKNKEKVCTSTQETETIKYTISIQAEPKQSTNEEPVPSTSGNVVKSVPMISLSSSKKDASLEKNITPEKTITSNSKLHLSLSSPRSTKSHIRALDFSTPPKENHSPRKGNTPRSLNSNKEHKIAKSPKTIRKRRSTIFLSPLKSKILPIATKSPKVKLKGDWNEDLLVTKDKDKNKSSPRLHRAVSKTPDVINPLEISEDNNTSGESSIKSIEKKLNSWDHELRSLIIPIASTSQTKKTPTKKRTRISQRNKDLKDKKEEQILCIEAELAKMEGSEMDTQPIKDKISEEKKKETKIEESDSKTVSVKRKRYNSKSKNIIQKVELNIKEENILQNIETEKPVASSTIQQQPAKVIPTEALRNMHPKIRKKCNTNNSIKKTPTNSEDNLKQKLTENETNKHTSEMKEMTILSPSKMNKNASKRTLVEQLVKDVTQTEKDVTQTEKDVTQTEKDVTQTEKDVTQTEKDVTQMEKVPTQSEKDPVPPKDINKSLSNIITPNILKETSGNEIIAKRNLIPVLETPMKDESLLLPKTPCLFTPFNLDSPLARILGEKLDTGDLAPFLSPSFPMTPSFPITPNLQLADTQSSYASRPTDYSNSSSYYQPSDSEQNQKLEQVLIDEAMKIETSELKLKHIKTSTPCKIIQSPESTSTINSDLGVTAKVRLSDSLLEESDSKSQNLSQLSLDSSSQTSSNSSSNSNYSSSSSNDSKENITKDDEMDVTVIQAPSKRRSITVSNEISIKLKTPILNIPRCTLIKNKNEKKTEKQISQGPVKRPRGRPKSPLKKSRDIKEINKANSIVKRPPGRPRKVPTIIDTKKQDEDEEALFEKHRDLKSNVTGSHAMLLKELEEKRIRTVTGLKTNRSVGRPRKKLITDQIKDNLKKDVRVTRAGKKKLVEKQDTTKKQVIQKMADKVLDPPFIPRKSKTPNKTSIEIVAAKLLKNKKHDITDENKLSAEQNQSLSISQSSICSTSNNISTVGYDDGLISYTPDEEIPRLHISSDEESITEHLNQSQRKPKKLDDSDLLVKELKERGIYLIPNKEKEKKTENLTSTNKNEQICNIQKENKEETSTEVIKNVLIETKEPNKSDKIEITSDIHLDKSKVIDVSKIVLTQGVITDIITGNSSKNSEAVQENNVTKKDVAKENTSDSTLDVSEGSDYEFHVKVIDESSPEYINITYDENNKTEKQLSDYNFTVLERNISANIYIEEFDSWEDKNFTVTPYIDIYSMSTRRKSKVILTNKSDSSAAQIIKPTDNITKSINETVSKTTDEIKTNLKPLEILFNECVDESSTDTIITVKEQEPKLKLLKSGNCNKSSNDANKKQKLKYNISNKSNLKKTISLEQYKINQNKDDSHIKSVLKSKKEIDIEHTDVVESTLEEEDLMNFALTGTDKIISDSTSQEITTKKRKAIEESMKQTLEKRLKPNEKHALLIGIDVESFLTKVHGPSDKS